MIRLSMMVLATGLMILAPRATYGQTHLVVVTGLAGDPQVAKELHEWATSLGEAAGAELGIPDSQIVYLAGDADRHWAAAWQRSTKDNVEAALTAVAARARPDAQIVIVLFGHGSSRSGESRFNLPGPDMTAADFAQLLALFPTQRITFVNTASASGDFIAALSGERRIVVTATKSGFERNQTLFGKFFSEAFSGARADVDKDERVSVLEAFQYARSEVARTYDQQNRLLTEHAQLDDNGDGQGTTEPDPEAPDGAVAQVTFLGTAPRVATAGDARVAALYDEKEAIEGRLAALRAQKDGLSAEIYERRLEELLLALAETASRIRQLEGGMPKP